MRIRTDSSCGIPTKFGTGLACVFSLVVLLMMAIVTFAADEPDSQIEQPKEQAAPDPTPEPEPTTEPKAPPKEKSLLERLGDELSKEVDDSPVNALKSAAEGVDKMDRAVKGMRTAGSKLDEGSTAEETQKIQKQVIQDLADIIDQLENPPPNKGGGGGGGGASQGGAGSSGQNRAGGRGNSSKKRIRLQSAGKKGMSQGQAAPGSTEEQDGGKTSENGTDSSPKSQVDRKAAEEAARRRKLEMDVWGHLPLHVREELLNTYGERMLPKYEHLVKQFYEALSTQGDPKKK